MKIINLVSYGFRILPLIALCLVIPFLFSNQVRSASLNYSTYLSGSNDDSAARITVDAAGNAYVVGHTNSTDLVGGVNTIAGGTDLFVVKYSSTGVLVWAKVFGSTANETASDIFVDGTGDLFVVGGIDNGSSFDSEMSATAFGPLGGVRDGVVVKLNASATPNTAPAIEWSTVLGGAGDDVATRVIIDGLGGVLVGGIAHSDNFPVTQGAYDTSHNSQLPLRFDTFVVSLSPTGEVMNWSTFVGGNGNDVLEGFDVDSNNKVYVSGWTESTDLPTTQGAYQTVDTAGVDAYVYILAANGGSLTYASYFGGNGLDDFNNLLIEDVSGELFLTGLTSSSDFDTTTGAYQETLAGASDGVLVRLDPAGNGVADLNWSTLFGGTLAESTFGIAYDQAGGVIHLSGRVDGSLDFDVTADAYQSSFQGGSNDAFFISISDDGQDLISGSYLGGSGNEGEQNYIAYDTNSDCLYVSGYTTSVNFPIGGSPAQSTALGGVESTVTQFCPLAELDYGDAPNTNYGTTFASNGARHTIGSLYLGASVDGEPEGLATADATGDDVDGADDENGVAFGTLRQAATGSATVVVSSNGKLDAWLDLNDDGDWGDAGEKIITNTAVTTGTNNLTFAVPVSATVATTIARFRLSSAGDLASTGYAEDGEVEDYQVALLAAQTDLSITKTDTPDPIVAGNQLSYTLSVVNNGPSAATGVVVTDTLPANLSSPTYAVNAVSQGAWNGTHTIGAMTNGQTVTIVITATVSASMSGTLTNNASVAGGETDPDATNNSTSAESHPTGPATTIVNGDYDRDGIGDNVDLDDDNDGVLDTVEDRNGDSNPGNDDSDGDGNPNYIDLDSDDDGIVDAIEANGGTLPANMDSNGQYPLVYAVANDADDDGLVDAVDPSQGGVALTNPDTDSDGVKDFWDIDADNDGIVDLVEGQITAGYIAPLGTDTDNDGIDNAFDADNSGTPIVPVDTDADLTADYRDLDSDADTVADNIEGHDANYNGVADRLRIGTDLDSDGLDDTYDTVTAPGTGNSAGSNAPLQNTDSVGDRDWRDTDDDNDGILSKNEDVNGNGSPIDDNTDADGRPNYLDVDDDGDGILTANEDKDADGQFNDDDTNADSLPNYLDPKPTQVSGRIFKDLDGDGVQDSGEVGIEGITVTVVDVLGVTRTVKTDANGNYSVAAAPGRVTVTFSSTDPAIQAGSVLSVGAYSVTTTVAENQTLSLGLTGLFLGTQLVNTGIQAGIGVVYGLAILLLITFSYTVAEFRRVLA